LYFSFTAARASLTRYALGSLIMKLGRLFCKTSVLIIAILLSAPWTTGQSTFGGIVGVVKDPSQGEVAGAELTLTNVDDHTERKAGTDANGALMSHSNLRPPRRLLKCPAIQVRSSIPRMRLCPAHKITSHSPRCRSIPGEQTLGRETQDFSWLRAWCRQALSHARMIASTNFPSARRFRSGVA